MYIVCVGVSAGLGSYTNPNAYRYIAVFQWGSGAVQIKCIEASGNDLYIGCSDGIIFHILVEERSQNSVLSYSTKIIHEKNLSTKRPISSLKSTSALSRLLVISDSNLFLLDADNLSIIGSGPRMKNILAFASNENPNLNDPFTLEFVIGKKKVIQLCSLHNDKINITKEIATNDAPICMAMDGEYVCVSGQLEYSIFNVNLGTCQNLFPVDPNVNPTVKRISKEEFLVIGPGGLGMFVTSARTSERPPIQWGDEVQTFSYYHPYIVTLIGGFIHVYSLMDQQHKQTIPLPGGLFLGNFDGQLYAATSSSIFCLMPLPWTTQVKALLDSGSVEEAIDLTIHSGGAGMTSEKYLIFTEEVYQRAGFVQFSLGSFEEAQEYFLKGRLDVRELLCLYSGLLDPVSAFERSQPPLHNMVNVSQIFQLKEKCEEAENFLKNYLLLLRNIEPVSHKLEIDTALIKLQISDSKQLTNFISGAKNLCVNKSECVVLLTNSKQYYALAVFYRVLNDIPACLNVLTKLCLEEISDPLFNGVEDVVKVIIEARDIDVLWQYIDFILSKCEKEGLKLLCEFPFQKSKFESEKNSGFPKQNVDCTRNNSGFQEDKAGYKIQEDTFTSSQKELENYADKALKSLIPFPCSRIKFIQHLIMDRNIQDEKYHTEIVLHYINQVEVQAQENAHLVSKKIGSKENISYEQAELRRILSASRKYNASVVLNKLKSSNLVFEKALVYGMLKKHDEALLILVHDLKDFKSADEYCSREADESNSLYTILLKTYLKPQQGETNVRDENIDAALNLLTKHSTSLKLESVLAVLPENWSSPIVQNYFKSALKTLQYENSLKVLKESLISSVYNQRKFVLNHLVNSVGPVLVSSPSICSVCGTGFKDSDFELYPNGVMVHGGCVRNNRVCPITGDMFKALPTSRKTDL